MNDFDNVDGLGCENRKEANLGTYDRWLYKNIDDLNFLKKEDKTEITNAVKGLGKIVAIADTRRTYEGLHKYVIFLEKDGEVTYYIYSKPNGLYNKMGPYKDIETALSNADCYGLFENTNQIGVNRIMEDNEFEWGVSDDWDDPMEDSITDFYSDDEMYDAGFTEKHAGDDFEDDMFKVPGSSRKVTRKRRVNFDWDGYNGDDGVFDGYSELDNGDSDYTLDSIGSPVAMANERARSGEDETSEKYFPPEEDDFYGDSEGYVHTNADGTISGHRGGNAVELVDYDPFNERIKNKLFDKILLG